MAGRHWSVGLVAVVCAWPCASGQVQFVDASGTAQFLAYEMAEGMVGGASAADFDGDGDIDVFVANGTGFGDQLYENGGAGVFEEVAGTLGLASVENNRGGLWLDYDGDHDLDLLVLSDNHMLPGGFTLTSMRLWRRESGGGYTEVTAAAGLLGLLYPAEFGNNHLGGAAAGDFDGDGWVDFVVTFWQTFNGGALAHLFMNNGDGSFTNATATSGMALTERPHWQPLVHDFDGDDLLDVFVAVDFEENCLWLNQGGGVFSNTAATAGVNNAWNDMGAALGDYDNDGDFDLMVTNIYADPQGGTGWAGKHNVLYRNESVGGAVSFSEVSEAAGVDEGDWGWGVTFVDVDCDGWLDVAQTNGFLREPAYENDRSRLFRSQGGDPVTFAEIGVGAGVDDTDVASCLIAVDVDRDGDQDLVQACDGGTLRLYENVTVPAAGSAGAGWLGVRPRMHGTNWYAAGTVVRVRCGAVWRSRLITAGTSMMGQEAHEAHFGLGSATVADEVVVEWPDGRVTTLAGVGVNQMVDVVIACRGDLDGDGDTDVLDFGTFATGFGAGGLDPFTGGDMDGDGDVDVFDFGMWVEDFGCW